MWVSGSSAVNHSSAPKPTTSVAKSTRARVVLSLPPSSTYNSANAVVASGYQPIQTTSGQAPQVSLVVSAA